MDSLLYEGRGGKTQLTFHKRIMRQHRRIIKSFIATPAKYDFMRNLKIPITVENVGTLNCFTEDYED